MADPTSSERVHGYCGLCIARCGCVAVVEDGRFTRLEPDPAHPTGQALCAKGRAAPELVYQPGEADPSAPPDPSEGRPRPRLGTDQLGRGTEPDRRRDASGARSARAGGGRLHPVFRAPPPRSAIPPASSSG